MCIVLHARALLGQGGASYGIVLLMCKARNRMVEEEMMGHMQSPSPQRCMVHCLTVDEVT